MSWQRIRPVALGAVQRGDDLLVVELSDDVTGETFYRLLGGGLEFGEHSRDALRREFDEELGVSLADLAHLGSYERVFEVDGEPGHEIWRVYRAEIVESWPYDRDQIEFTEDDGQRLTARWMSLETLHRDDVTFYAEEVLEDLSASS